MALTCSDYFGRTPQTVVGLLITADKQRIFRHYTCNSKKSPWPCRGTCNKITPAAVRIEFAYCAIDSDFRSKRNKKSILFHHYYPNAAVSVDARVLHASGI